MSDKNKTNLLNSVQQNLSKEDFDGEQVILRYIPVRNVVLWKENPKKHNIGAIMQSIQKYGFKDPPAFDSALEGLIEGNGRAEALLKMELEKQSCPRGILKHKETGEWLMPVLFGVDSKSKSLAERYAIDHNNLVLSGGDLTANDIARIWDRDLYTKLLTNFSSSGEELVTMDLDDISSLLELGNVKFDNSESDDYNGASSNSSLGGDSSMSDKDFFIVKLTFNNVSLKDDIVEQLEDLLNENIGWDGSIHVD